MSGCLKWAACLGCLILLLGISGCGGGGGTGDSGSTGGGVIAAKNVSWAPPTAYSDGSPLNAATDLGNYEIYVKQTGSFSIADTPTAIVSAVDPITHEITTVFNLANLGPFLQKGITYYVSMRSVALDGSKSDFSQSATFSL